MLGVIVAGMDRAERRSDISVYFPNLNSGGVERMHLSLAPPLSSEGFDTTIVVDRNDGSLASSVPSTIPVFSLKAARSVGAIFPLAKYIREQKPSIVVANMGHPNLIALFANWLAGRRTRIIMCQHNHLTNQSAEETKWQHKVLPMLYRVFLRHADAIVCVSRGVADDLAKTTGVPRERISVIYNPAVPVDAAARAAQPADHPWFGGDKPVIVAVGRLVAAKDYPTMLSALAKVPDARLLILGEGHLRATLDEQVAQLGIGDRVDFVGFVKNPFAYMARADLFLLSSRYEGFGNVVAEALSCGVPVVSTDCESGPAEILEDGVYGRLVPIANPDAMAQAISLTLAEPRDPERLKARAAMFTVDVATREYAALYRTVLTR